MASAAGGDRTFTQGSAGSPFTLDHVGEAVEVTGADDESIDLVPGFPTQTEEVAWSAPLDLGAPGVAKEFLGMYWTEQTFHGTYVRYFYSVNGGPWLAAEPGTGEDGVDLPEATHGETIAYKIVLWSAVAATSPSVDDITITWRRWTGKPSGGGDGNGDDPGRPRRSGSAHGSGTFTYPGPSGTGTGTGSGGGGTGSGAGSGAGTGSGGGSGDGVSAGGGTAGGSASGTSVQASTVDVPAPPASASTGAEQAVSGLAVDGETSITGVRLEQAGGRGAGRSSRPGGGASSHGWQLSLVGLGVGLGAAALVFAPWFFISADMREASDPERWRRSRAARSRGTVAS